VCIPVTDLTDMSAAPSTVGRVGKAQRLSEPLLVQKPLLRCSYCPKFVRLRRPNPPGPRRGVDRQTGYAGSVLRDLTRRPPPNPTTDTTRSLLSAPMWPASASGCGEEPAARSSQSPSVSSLKRWARCASKRHSATQARCRRRSADRRAVDSSVTFAWSQGGDDGAIQ
jgi:hypothetical protein